MKKPDILIVDDEESQRFLLRDFLTRDGYEVGAAENGIKALKCVRDKHFDIILLDYNMPEMDGLTVLKEVKRINPEIDVVIISAYGTTERSEEAVKAGAFYYITKPVELDELLILLDSISKRRARIQNRRDILRQALVSVSSLPVTVHSSR